MNKLRDANTPKTLVDQNALMNNMAVPHKILESLWRSQGVTYPFDTKWGQLKHWLAQRNMSQQLVNQLLGVQIAQFETYVKDNPALATALLWSPGSNTPPASLPPPKHSDASQPREYSYQNLCIRYVGVTYFTNIPLLNTRSVRVNLCHDPCAHDVQATTPPTRMDCAVGYSKWEKLLCPAFNWHLPMGGSYQYCAGERSGTIE